MTIAEQEESKYRRMWARPEYKHTSPGERVVKTFLSTCDWHEGDTLIDLGAGTGRAAKILADKGLRVKMFDCCPQANETDLPCIQGILWDIPPSLPRFDWIFCTDVLEHIPTEYVGATLDQMAALTIKGGFLQIALVPDQCGPLIGETLHLTVQTESWWKQQVYARWPILKSQPSNGVYACFTIGAPKCLQKQTA